MLHAVKLDPILSSVAEAWPGRHQPKDARVKKVENNASSVFQAVTSYVAANAPRGLDQRSRAEVQQTQEGGQESDTRLYLHLRFARAKADVELRIEMGRVFDYETVESEGDLFRVVRLDCEMGCYSSSSCTPGDMLVKAELMREVALFGAELLGNFPDTCHQIISTKAEREARAFAQEQQSFRARITQQVRAHMQGKRPGAQVTLDGWNFIEARDRHHLAAEGGSMQVTIEKRTYEVQWPAFASENEAAWPVITITRTDVAPARVG